MNIPQNFILLVVAFIAAIISCYLPSGSPGLAMLQTLFYSCLIVFDPKALTPILPKLPTKELPKEVENG